MSDYLKKLATMKAEQAAGEPRCCWRCGAGPDAPDLDEQLDHLSRAHAMQPEIYHLTNSELANLRRLLQAGDIIAIVANVHRIFNPSYTSITIIRDGKLMQIDRRSLGS